MSAILDALLRAKAEKLGAPASHSDVVAMLARRHLDVRPDGSVKVLDSSGNVRIGAGPDFEDMSIAELLDELSATRPALFGAVARAEPKPVKPEPEPEAPAGETVTAMEVRLAAAKRQNSPGTLAVALEINGNPYLPASHNDTLAVALEGHDPALAAQLRDQAKALSPVVPLASNPHPR